MLARFAAVAVVMFGFALFGFAQENEQPTPIELEVLKSYVGVWDAEIQVWAQGPDLPPITFQGVEINRPYGRYWIASDFDSEIMGRTMKIHSIVGYDLDQKRLVGMIIDYGPYSATMTGEYDAESKTVTWTVQAKTPDGKPMVQSSNLTQKGPDERMLVVSVPRGEDGELSKFMQVVFTKRAETPAAEPTEVPKP